MHIEVPHSCGRTHHGWQSLAECTWPDAYYVVGDGPYALLARCDLFTVTLYETVTEARRRRKHLDLRGCGKKCRRDHALFSLAGDELDPTSRLLQDPQENALDWLRTS